MEEKNELNDIILNKSSKSNRTKKVLLTIATFSIVLIIVVVIMNRFTAKTEMSLPHAPETAKVAQVAAEDVIVEPVYEAPTPDEENATAEAPSAEDETVTQQTADQALLSQETVPVKQKEVQSVEVFEEPQIIKEPEYVKSASPKTETKPAAKRVTKVVQTKKEPTAAEKRPSGKYDPKSKRVLKTKQAAAAETGSYFIQVGSFAKSSPSQAFLDKITNRGYTYNMFHQSSSNGKTLTKVLIGPFKTEAAAREALPVIRKRVMPTAFLIKL
ncbi:SPOR domain-containing protein [Sulfurimonas sp. HSL3-7]|uniref:SPOR domain-containing protein n=1 Tax=Sulfonitrofixus jiaomeiensis TaxID=3131938 RepID=UPI0031F8B0E5